MKFMKIYSDSERTEKVRSFIFGAVESIEKFSCLIYVDLNKKLFEWSSLCSCACFSGEPTRARVVKVSRSFNLCTFCLKSLFFFFTFSSLFLDYNFLFFCSFASGDILVFTFYQPFRLKGFFVLSCLWSKRFCGRRVGIGTARRLCTKHFHRGDGKSFQILWLYLMYKLCTTLLFLMKSDFETLFETVYGPLGLYS